MKRVIAFSIKNWTFSKRTLGPKPVCVGICRIAAAGCHPARENPDFPEHSQEFRRILQCGTFRHCWLRVTTVWEGILRYPCQGGEGAKVRVRLTQRRALCLPLWCLISVVKSQS